MRSPYIEHATSALPNPIHLEGEDAHPGYSDLTVCIINDLNNSTNLRWSYNIYHQTYQSTLMKRTSYLICLYTHIDIEFVLDKNM